MKMKPLLKFRQLDLTGSRWTPIAGNWSRQSSLYVHSPEGVTPQSFNIYACDREIRDGAIEATVRVSPGGDGGRLLFRYGPQGGYYAGVGGYGHHFAIVKQFRTDHGGMLSQGITVDGRAADVRHGEPSELRVEFIGDQITLKSSGVTVLEATDSWFQGGYIGFETYG